jgi:Ubiquinol-cytochrome C reductase, UQCRX/QCR9 like
MAVSFLSLAFCFLEIFRCSCSSLFDSYPPPFTTHSSSETVSSPFPPPKPPLSSGFRFLPGVYVTSIFVGAFAFGIGFDVAVSRFWDSWNRGVR